MCEGQGWQEPPAKLAGEELLLCPIPESSPKNQLLLCAGQYRERKNEQ